MILGRNTEERLKNCVFEYLHYRIGVEVWSKLFSRKIILDNNIRFCENSNNFAEDFGFMVKYLLYTEKVEVIPFYGYNYYVRENATTQKGKSLVRLNELNEISKDIAITLRCLMDDTQEYEKNEGMLHFLVMYNQYLKLYGEGRLSALPQEIDKIEDIDWFRKSTKLTIKNRKYLRSYLGKSNADRIILLSKFCLHKNWRRYCLESTIYYKFFYREDDTSQR